MCQNMGQEAVLCLRNEKRPTRSHAVKLCRQLMAYCGPTSSILALWHIQVYTVVAVRQCAGCLGVFRSVLRFHGFKYCLDRQPGGMVFHRACLTVGLSGVLSPKMNSGAHGGSTRVS